MIRDGKLKPAKGRVIGVNIKANQDTQVSIPYLTHTDFTKCVKELVDFCDYVTINLCDDA